MSEYEGQLARLATLAARTASETDRQGAFPKVTIDYFLAGGLAGLISSPEYGGLGGNLGDASRVVEQIAGECGSTAMIVAMHYSGAAVIEALGGGDARKKVGRGNALATLAFSEFGSRSHFWAPVSTARREGDEIVLDAKKSWITSASHADLIVWSSRASEGNGVSVWLVPGSAQGLASAAPFDGMGLRGNDSAPVDAVNLRIPRANLLGQDGGGMDVMLRTTLPVFAVLNASAAVGMMRGAISRTVEHASATRLTHLDQSISRFPTVRAYIARMQIKADLVSALIDRTIASIAEPSEETLLRVLEVKAAAGESATEVLDLAMRVCGGAAFRKEVGVERFFRDARANTVMAPTTDQLYDFIGRALCGMDLFD